MNHHLLFQEFRFRMSLHPNSMDVDTNVYKVLYSSCGNTTGLYLYKRTQLAGLYLQWVLWEAFLGIGGVLKTKPRALN